MLTGEQKAALAFDGDLLLTACPGSGKTRTITEKLLLLIDGVRETPRAVACITYTNTAVHEIEERIAPDLREGDDRHYTVSTIHSFCLNYILRPFAWLLPGFTRVPKVLTRDKPVFEEIVRYACEQVNLFTPNTRDFEAFEGLNVDRDGNLIGVALRNEAVKRAAPHFWRRCQELGYIDFCSIIYDSYRLLKAHPRIAQSLAARFAFLLVDEFQDTTEVQTEIFKLIRATGRMRVFAVGDTAQSIYGFTGARPELLPSFAAATGARTDLSLTGNFRSSQLIVGHAERLFARNPAMLAVGRNKEFAVEPEFALVDDTFEAITDVFLPRLLEHGIPYGEATILGKEWAPLAPLARRLRDYGIPVVGPGARPYRKSRLFATLAEQLCGAVTDPQPETTRQLERALFNAVHDVTAYPRFDIFSVSGRVCIVRLLREAKRLAGMHGGVGWLDNMSNFTDQELFAAGYIEKQQAGLFYASVQEMKLDMHSRNVDLANLSIDDLGLFASPMKALRLSSIHFAKGREYDAVALVGLREGTLPHYLSKTAPEIEAEKRLFYVGVTRPRKYLLYVTENDPRWNNGPSRFLGSDGVNVLDDPEF